MVAFFLLFNGCGDDSSSPTNPVIPEVQKAPTAPAELAAVVVSPVEISLSWVDSSANEEHFELYTSVGSDNAFTLTATLDSNVITYNATGLTPATSYWFKVRAERLDTLFSGYTNVVTATTPDGKPLAPANLRATSISASAIVLLWEDRSDDETGFKIWRKAELADPFTEHATMVAGDTTYTDASLDSRTTYYYQITAYNTYGFNESNIANATTGSLPPGSPINLTGKLDSSTELSIAWEFPSDDADSFNVHRKVGSDEWAIYLTIAGNLLALDETNLTPNTEYSYKIDAFNVAGFGTDVAGPLTLTTVGAPTGLTVTTKSQTELDIEWTAGSTVHSGFKVERKTGVEAWTVLTPAGIVETSYSDAGLSADVTYEYRVNAYSADGPSDYCDPANATTLRNAPPKPTNVSTTILSGTEIKLSWTDNSSGAAQEDGFKVYRKNVRTEWTLITTTDPDIASFTDQGLAGSTSYSYCLQAFNNGGISDTSVVAVGITTPAVMNFALGTTGLEIGMSWIPDGIYTMGSPDSDPEYRIDELPQHVIDLQTGFWIGAFEVTQKQWLTVMGAFPDTVKSKKYGVGDTYPVYAVSFNDVKQFIDSLNAQEGAIKWRLPSEAEWEYSARATTTTRFYFGNDPEYTELPKYGWFEGNATGARPIGGKIANAWLLKDMHGNVAEFCEDWYHDAYDNAPTDGSPWMNPVGNTRVLRGGSWYSDRHTCRSAARMKLGVNARDYSAGFRLVRIAD